MSREPTAKPLSTRQAAFIGVGSMVGAGIFALLGAAGAVAGAAVTVEKVIASGGTALAVAAQPALGQAGYWLMSVTALFATAGATNAGLYPAPGVSERLAETGQFPPLMAHKVGGRASSGLLIQAVICLVLAVGFKLDAIASIGSAVALLIFTLITVAHLRVRHETGASAVLLWLAIATAGVVLVSFVITALVSEPASIATLLAILVLAVGLDRWWKRVRDRSGQAGTRPGPRAHGVMKGARQ